MYALLKTLASQLLMPLPVLLGLLCLGLVLISLGRRRSGLGTAALAVVFLLLASTAPLADRLLEPLEASYPALDDLPQDTDIQAVVVLGGGWQPEKARSVTGRLSDSSSMRLMEGIRLWRQRPELPLVVSGASRQAERPAVAEGYAQAAAALGVPLKSLIVSDTPTDTGEEAQAVRDALGEGATLVLVTSASHMPRAMAHFYAAGLAPVAAPTHYLVGNEPPGALYGWAPSARNLRKTERALYEAMGRMAVRFE